MASATVTLLLINSLAGAHVFDPREYVVPGSKMAITSALDSASIPLLLTAIR